MGRQLQDLVTSQIWDHTDLPYYQQSNRASVNASVFGALHTDSLSVKPQQGQCLVKRSVQLQLGREHLGMNQIAKVEAAL